MLKRLDDLAPFDWIANSSTPMPTEPYTPVRVSNCVPACFPAYSKLFHPIYTDATVVDYSVSWHQAEGPTYRSVGIESGGTLVRKSSHGREKGDRIRWQQLAMRYGLVFHPEINAESFTRSFRDRSWPRYLLGPDEGTLDSETTEALMSVLVPFTNQTACFFHYSELSAKGFAPRLYRGDLLDVMDCLDLEDVFATPDYWWPENQEWCVCTDWDLPFTLVGGSQSVVDAIDGHPLLEVLHVTPMSRVDYQADEVNRSSEAS